MNFDYRGGSWDLRERVRVVGILNVTPDSFYDGGRYARPQDAIARAEAMVAEGADSVDVGAQSTRPGAGTPLSAEDEWQRLEPVVAPLAARLPVPLSIDTYHAETARRALDQGAAIVNDVSGLTHEPALADHVARAGAGLVLMHALGVPGRRHESREYGDVAAEVAAFLAARVAAAVDAGVGIDSIVVDPGVDFAKTPGQSVALLRGLDAVVALGRPVLLALSRKDFVGALTRRPPADRGAGTLGAVAAVRYVPQQILRVHDVAATLDMLTVLDAVAGPDAPPADLVLPEELRHQSR